MAEFVHEPVLLNEAIEWLDCRKGLIYIDGTVGGGGHSKEIAKRISPDGRLISMDVDPDAIAAAEKNLAPYKDIATIVRSSYINIPEVLKNLNIEKITGGVLLDIGASYYQLTTQERGFSFSKEAPLDMRFNPDNPVSAYDVVNSYSEQELIRIFSEYGEERYSKRIARKIVEVRQKQPIKTTIELANIVKFAVPKSSFKIHPATRVFQAIRMKVNNELGNIEKSLKEVIPLLEKNARIVVISFHSLEDRLVKNLFKYYSSKCNCRPEQLICTCEPKQLEVLTKKPIIASEEEIRRNPPSRSAKMRVAEKV
ncbi:MAG: S-adenosyl-methyltransferase MraW [uncultured bacterium]|nr:MAG: S-adenosyl-methyltransferase MraW [uncultured bacterium]